MYTIRVLGANVPGLGRAAFSTLMKTTEFLIGPTINIISILTLLREAAFGLLVTLRVLLRRPN